MKNRYAIFHRQLLTTDPGWVAEYRFHPARRWRFDFALPLRSLAIEIDGGVWMRGRHSRGKGQISDMEKGNAATALGWRVLHFTPQDIHGGAAMRAVREIMWPTPTDHLAGAMKGRT